MHRQVFLNSLFSFVLGASSVSPLISIWHPTVASDNLRDGREGVLPSTPPFHPAPHGPAHTDTCRTAAFAWQNGVAKYVFPQILLFSLNDPPREALQVIWYLFSSLFLVAEKYSLV